jgi:transposase
MTVHDAPKRNGITYKKCRLYLERDEEKRKKFTDFEKANRKSRLVYVDESGHGADYSYEKNRKIQRPYDADLYNLRHIIENTFLRLKDWRGIATRYAKNVKSFIAAVQIGCLMLWLKIS